MWLLCGVSECVSVCVILGGSVQKAGLVFPGALVLLVIKPLFKVEVIKYCWLSVVAVVF